MNNQFRNSIAEQEEDLLEQEEQVAPKAPSKPGSTTVFFKKLFIEGSVTKESATDMLPFIIFLCFLGMVYIANSHMAMKNVRSISQLSKDVKDLNYEYKSLKADLMFKSKLTAIAEKVDTLGLKVLVEPPKRLLVNRP